MSQAYIVRSFTVPVRMLRLQEVMARVGNRLRTSTASRAVYENIDESQGAYTWSLVVNVQSLATLWRAYMLNHVRPLLKRYARIVLGEKYEARLEELWRSSLGGDEDARRRLALYLAGLADVLSYMLRYPLYREPVRPGKRGLLGLYTPSLVPLVARVSWITRVMHSGETSGEIDAFIDAMEAVWGGEEAGGLEKIIADMVSGIVDEDTSYLLELLFYLAPADTRPGGNTSSLLLHLLMVSAGSGLLVSEIARSRGGGLDAPVARLAGLLHDSGKPVNPARHVDESVRLAREMLEGLVPASILEIVAELVRVHHSSSHSALARLEELLSSSRSLFVLAAEELHGALVCADHSMTGLDRVLGLVLRIARGEVAVPGRASENLASFLETARRRLQELGKRLAEEAKVAPCEALAALLAGTGDPATARRVQEAYRRLLSEKKGRALVARASEAVARLFSAPRPSNLDSEMNALLRDGWPPASCTRLREHEQREGLRFGVGVVDIGGIQASLSESFKLRSLAGLSLLVDYLTQAMVPYALTMVGVPPEAIIFAGGGTVQFLSVVRDNVASVEGNVEQAIWRVLGHRGLYEAALTGVKIRVGVASLDDPLYSLNVERAYQRVAAAKASEGKHGVTSRWLAGLFAPLARPCSSCGKRPASISFHGDELCLVCASRYRVSAILGYLAGDAGYRRMLVEAFTGANLPSLVGSETLLRDFDPVRLVGSGFGIYGQGNYAILKSDGNSMGVFMSSSMTATMFFERSVRVDLATKNSLARLFTALVRANASREAGKRLAAALIYGFMYAGGDDLLLFLPARIALPAAALLAYEFTAELGFIASLSVGVVAAPYKHNVWWSIDAATRLLDDVAKPSARGESIGSLLRLQPVNSGGSIAFDYSDGWGLNGVRALSRYETTRSARLTLQPLPLLGDNASLVKLLSLFTGRKCSLLRTPRTSIEDGGDKELRTCIEEALKEAAYGRAHQEAKEIYKSIVKGISRAGGLRLTPGGLDLVAAALLQELGDARANGTKPVASLLSTLLEEFARSHVLPLHDVYLFYKFMRGD